MKSTLGVSAGNQLVNTDYQQAIRNLNAAYADMMAKIGLPAAQAAIPIMKAVGDFFVGMGQWAVKPENADTLKRLAEGITILGAAFIRAGIVALLAALGPGGWLILAWGALSAALIALQPQLMHFVEWVNALFNAGIDRLAAMLKEVATAMATLYNSGIDKLAAMLNAVSGAITSFGTTLANLWEKIKGLTNLISYEGVGIGGGGGGVINASLGGGTGGGGDMIGEVERSGALRQYLRTGGYGMDPKTQAWCAAYTGAWLSHHGYASTGSLMATSYLNYGSPVSGEVKEGDVVVLGRGRSRPVAGHLGHVGIATGRTRGNQVEIIAGDYGHRVGHEWEPRSQAVIRRPTPKHEESQEVHLHTHVNIDGREVAHAVTKHQTHLAQFPASAPYFDGSRSFTSPDHGLATA